MGLGEITIRFSIGVTSLVVGARRFSCCWVAHSIAGVVFGWISTINLAPILDTITSLPGSPLGMLNVLRVHSGNAPNDATLGHTLAFSVSIAILPVRTCTYNSRRPTQERPTGMDLILWVEVDTDLFLTESPVDAHGVQQNGPVVRSEFGDIPPLATSKSLEDEEKDEGEGEIPKEAKALRENGTLPVDPRDPQEIIWKSASVCQSTCEHTGSHLRRAG